MGRTLPPLNPLKAFEAAARLHSLSLAARELGVSQVAVSRQVRVLESYLGIDLFIRTHKHVEPSEDGKLFQAELTKAFDAIDAATKIVGRRGQKNVLTLQCYTTFCQRWLIPRLPSFFQQYPKTELRLSLTTVEDTVGGEADATIRSGNGDWPQLHAEKLIDLDLVPVCAPSLLQAPLREPRDLKAVTLLHSRIRPNDWAAWLQANQVEGVEPYKGTQFEISALAYEAAIKGLGVAIGIRALVEQNLKEGLMVVPFPISHRLEGGYYLTWPRNRPPSPMLLMFRTWLARQMHEEAAQGGT